MHHLILKVIPQTKHPGIERAATLN
jgi:hypothetical protein